MFKCQKWRREGWESERVGVCGDYELVDDEGELEVGKVMVSG